MLHASIATHTFQSLSIMASTSTQIAGGYTCEFLNGASEDFYCFLCRHVSRDPHITSCCGEHFCHTCIAPLLQEKQPCPAPTCSAQQFTTLLNVKYQQKILQLNVRCSLRERGCQWVGPLSALDSHLDPSVGDCQFLDADCPNKCGQKVTKDTLYRLICTQSALRGSTPVSIAATKTLTR